MHPLLQRQIARVYGRAGLPVGVERLAALVEEAYVWFDDERKMNDRAMSLASEELVVANAQLRRDLAARKQIETALRRSDERYALALRGANDGIFDWDCSTEKLYLSDRWYEMLGLVRTPDDEGPLAWAGRVHPDDIKVLHDALRQTRPGDDTHRVLELRVWHADGSWVWVVVRACAVYDGDGRMSRLAGSLTDITSHKQQELRIRHAATHDGLTGLPNRTLLLERLTEALARAGDPPARHDFALCFLDMDRFKLVNDSLGHTAGDRLLVELAGRIGGCLRSTDTLARLGGDEFVALLPGVCTGAAAGAAAGRIFDALRTPIRIDGHDIFAGVSIGVALSGPEYADPHALLRDADTALYQAKGDGTGKYRIFDQSMRHRAVRSLQLDSDLRRAVEQQEFEMNYQPIVDLEDGRLAGFEALVRWRHPTRGLVPPGEFIPVAEQTGIMVRIGDWVLRETCRQAAAWNARFPGMRGVTVAVNLSAVQFQQPGLADRIAAVLADTGVPAHQLTLEVTESVVMGDADSIKATFDQLKTLGLNTSIDDFGTGYSSLACLHRFAFDCLKIDRAFVSRAPASSEGFDIIETIATLGHRLGMRVVAEGMETRPQLEHVVRAGCDRAQGYYFSRPLTAMAAESLLVRPMFDLLQPLAASA